MKVDIILAGVGGQGILSIASIIGTAAIEKGLYLKQAETHGMSQRGGAVISHLRIADYPVASDLIPNGKADVIISVEPMESLRYLNFLSKTGCVVTNTVMFINIPNYPPYNDILAELEKLPRYVAIDAEKIAREIGNPKASNMVMLGAATPFIKLSPELIEKNIERIFEPKGESVVSINKEAFKLGFKFVKEKK
jgi:indolepyruvate ferredoxin oxidoreductase, beta subunit